MKLAIFDFDGTLFPRETLPFLMKCWQQMGYPRTTLAAALAKLLPLYLAYKMKRKAGADSEQMRMRAVSAFNVLFTGMTRQQMREFFRETAARMADLFNMAVVQEIDELQKKDYHIVLLSGAYHMLLEEIAQQLNMDTAIGTPQRFEDDILKGTNTSDVVMGEQKAQRLLCWVGEREIDWCSSWAYADSFSDVVLLQLVGNPVAVSPDQELEGLAKNSGWRIIL